MNIPLLIMYSILIFMLGIDAQRHGQVRQVKDSFWIALIATIINLILIWWMLGWKFF